MPRSIQPSAIDDSFEYTPTMSWTRPPQQVEYQHWVEPGDTRSAIDDRCKTEYGFVPDRPSFAVGNGAAKLAPNLGRTIVESKKAAVIVEPAKPKPLQAETVKTKSTTPRPSSRPRPIHRYKSIVIQGKDGQTDIKHNPFRVQRDASKTQPSVPASDPPKLEDKATRAVARSSSSSEKQKVRIVGKDGQEKIMKLSMPLRYAHSPSVTEEKIVKPTAPAPSVEKRQATPVKVDQTSHTARRDEPPKRAQRQQTQDYDRPTEAKKNTDTKKDKIVTNAQNSQTKTGTEEPRQLQLSVSDIISEIKARDSVSLRMSGSRPTSDGNSKVHSAHDSGVAFGSANTSARGSATSKDTSKSSRTSSLPTNKSSSTQTCSGIGWDSASSHASGKAAQKAADVCSKVPSKEGTEKTSEASKKSITPVVDTWGHPPAKSGSIGAPHTSTIKSNRFSENDWGKSASNPSSAKPSRTPTKESSDWGNSISNLKSARSLHTPTNASDDWGKLASDHESAKPSRTSTKASTVSADNQEKSTIHSRSAKISPLSGKDDIPSVDDWEKLDSWLGSAKSSPPACSETKAPAASHSSSAKASCSSKKDDIPPMPSQSKTSKTSHASTKQPSMPRDARIQTSQSTIQNYREWAKSSRSSGISNHQAAFATAPPNLPSIRSESFADASRNGDTTYARPGDITPHPLSVRTHDMSDRQPPQVEPAWEMNNRATTWGSQFSHHTGMVSHEPFSSLGSMASGQSKSNHSFVPSTVPDIDFWDRASQTPTIPFGEPGYVASAHGPDSRMTHRQPTVESVEPTPLPYDESNQHEFWFDGGSWTPQSRPQPTWAGNRPSQVEIPKGYESTDLVKPSPLLYPYPYHYLDPFKTNTEGIRRQMRAREGNTGSRVDQIRHCGNTPKP